MCLRLGNTDSDVLLLKSGDRASYLRSRELLDPLGISLEMAAAVVAMMRRELVTPSAGSSVRSPHEPSTAGGRELEARSSPSRCFSTRQPGPTA